MSSYYTERIRIPHPDSVNSGLSPAKQSTMLRVFGAPRHDKPVNGASPTNKKLLKLIETRNVGPFRATGLKLALDSLERIFARVKKEKPELYVLLQSAGMLNVRLVRGSDTNYSNHSWGSAIDFYISGILDKVGDRGARF